MTPTNKHILHMLRESNAIEGEFSRNSLIDSLRAWKYIMQFDELNNNIIKETHRLLTCRLLARKYAGDWRDCPVTIGRVVKWQPKIVIDSQMRDYCAKLSASKTGYDAIALHLEFESIHPFIDGNGRMGRILMNWRQLKSGFPLIVFDAATKYEVYYPLFHNDSQLDG
jgi:fido (protein-threonine AMPylation protein)